MAVTWSRAALVIVGAAYASCAPAALGGRVTQPAPIASASPIASVTLPGTSSEPGSIGDAASSVATAADPVDLGVGVRVSWREPEGSGYHSSFRPARDGSSVTIEWNGVTETFDHTVRDELLRIWGARRFDFVRVATDSCEGTVTWRVEAGGATRTLCRATPLLRRLAAFQAAIQSLMTHP